MLSVRRLIEHLRSRAAVQQEGRGASAVQFQSKFCPELFCKKCLLIYGAAHTVTGLSSVQHGEEHRPVLFDSEERTGRGNVAAVVRMAFGIDNAVVYEDIVAADDVRHILEYSRGAIE